MRAALEGKIAVVTGGAKGVGRAVCHALARSGAHVVINYFHSADAASATLAEIRAAGGSAETLRASVGKKDAVDAMFAQLRAQHGGIDILVNNAAKGTLAPWLTLTERDWDRAMTVNLDGARWCAQAAAPLMSPRGGGTIVNLSSIGASNVFGNYATVGVSKAAVEALTRYLAVELAPLGIRVNAASAGLMDNATLPLFPEADGLRQVVQAATPLGRLATEEDLAHLAVFLSSESSGFITGQVILADGGLSLGHVMLSPPKEASVPGAGRQEPATAPQAAPQPLTVQENALPDGADRLVAVVGMGIAVPGASSPDEYWRLLNEPVEAFTEPGDRFDLTQYWSPDPTAADRTYSRVAGYLHDFRPHPDLTGWPRGRHDQAALWLRHCLAQARENVRSMPGDRSAVYVGAWPGGSQNLAETMVVDAVTDAVAARCSLKETDLVRRVLRARYPHTLDDVAHARPDGMVRDAIHGLLDNPVEVLVVDTACSSSLYAVDLGVKALLSGDCDVAYCGGVEVLDPANAVLFAKLRGLSPSGRVRSLDQDADGTLFSDGSSMVALKTLSRALVDGDKVLGVLVGFGAAADGRGKSISAPNPAGQHRAVLRARAVNAVQPDDVDWVVAHATGTAVGDRSELQILAQLSPEDGYYCTGNKAVIGHTGWAAGTCSLIHALLAFDRESIPAQPHFQRLAEGVDPSRIQVPAHPAKFPAQPDRPRTVGISAFGFGGTNGHLLVQDRPRDAPLPRSAAPSRDDEIVLVGWGAHLPGSPSYHDVRTWLRDQEGTPACQFERPYPLPPATQMRLSPRTLRAIDPCQIMAIEAATKLAEKHGSLWSGLQEHTGVIACHTGPLRALTEATLRCYADGVLDTVREQASPRVVKAIEDYLGAVRTTTPPASEDSQAGVMTNVVASRIAAHLDLHGATMTVDAGADTLLAGLDVARRYLLSGELQLALVLGVSADVTPESVGKPTLEPVGEGAYLMALATRGTAKEHGWPLLATVLPEAKERDTPPVGVLRTYRTVLETAIDVLSAAERGRAFVLESLTGTSRSIRIVSTDTDTDTDTVSKTEGRTASAPPRTTTPEWRSDEQKPLPSTLTTGYTRSLIKAPALPADEPGPAVPAGSVVLLGPGVGASPLRPHLDRAAVILTCDPAQARDGVLFMDNLTTKEGQQRVRQAVGSARSDITVLADFSAVPSWPSPPTSELLRLHDLLFLTAQHLWPRWQPASTLAVLLAGQPDLPHPHAALFTGTIRSLAWEQPASAIFSVLTDTPLGPAALRTLAAERGLPTPPPVLRHKNGSRYGEQFVPQPPLAHSVGSLGRDGMVVVASGGAGGVCSALLDTLGENAQATLWLIGRTRLQSLPEEILATPDSEITALRSRLLRQAHKTDPDLPIHTLIAQAEETIAARRVHRVVERLRRRHGEARVHYLACDLLDPQATGRAVEHIRQVEKRVDLVIHAAGLPGVTLLTNKSLTSFQRVRDTKLIGYHNLRASFGTDLPSLWCNVGSILGGALGLPGEADYCAGNEFLAATAEHGATPGEYTIGFPLWAEDGIFAADTAKRDYLRRTTTLTAVPTSEAVAQFVQETQAAATGRPSATNYFGKTELEMFTAERTGQRSNQVVSSGSHLRRAAYLHRAEQTSTGSWQLRFEAEQDSYLHDHLVDGKPTLPGTFMLEIAAEAAEALCPGHITWGFRDADFNAFIRPFSARTPLRLQITAQTIHMPTDSENETRVRVTLESSITLPDRKHPPLRRKHFSTEVILRQTAVPRTPGTGQRPPAHGRPVPDPYYHGDSPVLLKGIYRNTTDSRTNDQGSSATWAPRLGQSPQLLSFTLPALLLCATARIAALPTDTAGRQTLYVPRRMGRIDLFSCGENDTDLARRYGDSVTLHSDAQQTFRAYAPGGQVLLEMAEVEMEPMGTVPAEDHSGTPLPDGTIQQHSQEADGHFDHA